MAVKQFGAALSVIQQKMLLTDPGIDPGSVVPCGGCSGLDAQWGPQHPQPFPPWP